MTEQSSDIRQETTDVGHPIEVPCEIPLFKEDILDSKTKQTAELVAKFNPAVSVSFLDLKHLLHQIAFTPSSCVIPSTAATLEDDVRAAASLLGVKLRRDRHNDVRQAKHAQDNHLQTKA